MSTDSALGGVRLALVDGPTHTARRDVAELDRLATALDGPVRIEVTGRAGVGRSSLVAELGPIEGADLVEPEARDRPGQPDPVLSGDVVVLVVLDPPRDVDRAAAVEASTRLLSVLAKTDTLTDLDASLARAHARLDAPCLPVTTVGVDTGLPRLRETLDERVRVVRAARASALLAHLRTLSDRNLAREPIDEFLACDQGVQLAAQATGRPNPAGDARTRAGYWRRRMNTEHEPEAIRDALALHRAAVREVHGA